MKTVRAIGMGTACVATLGGRDMESLADICVKHQWSLRELSGRSTLAEIQDSIIRSNFEDLKGHEFRFVYLLNLNDGSLILNSIPREERWRTVFQIYVAMTRAQDELFLFSVGDPSPLIEPVLPFVERLTAAGFFGS